MPRKVITHQRRNVIPGGVVATDGSPSQINTTAFSTRAFTTSSGAPLSVELGQPFVRLLVYDGVFLPGPVGSGPILRNSSRTESFDSSMVRTPRGAPVCL